MRRTVYRFRVADLKRIDALCFRFEKPKSRAAMVRALCLVALPLVEEDPALAAFAKAVKVVAAPPVRPERVTMRSRILAAVNAAPEEVFSAASMAAVVGSDNRDSVRNTLGLFAARGKSRRVSDGRFQALAPDGAA